MTPGAFGLAPGAEEAGVQGSPSYRQAPKRQGYAYARSPSPLLGLTCCPHPQDRAPPVGQGSGSLGETLLWPPLDQASLVPAAVLQQLYPSLLPPGLRDPSPVSAAPPPLGLPESCFWGACSGSLSPDPGLGQSPWVSFHPQTYCPQTPLPADLPCQTLGLPGHWPNAQLVGTDLRPAPAQPGYTDPLAW